MTKTRIAVIAAAAALVLAVAGFFVGKHLLLNHRTAPAGAPVVVDIPKGSSVLLTAGLLKKAGVVDSPALFAAASRLAGKGGCIRAGEYQLSPAMTFQTILNLLCSGKVVLHSLTIPEGFSMRQIVDRAGALGLLDAEEARELLFDAAFLESLGIEAGSLEGYLFPTTYRLPRGMGARGVIAMMVRRYQKEWARLAAQAKARGLTETKAVILASIIEREALLDAERPLVSSVYHNRLKKGMRLQADPTVIYGMNDFDGNLKRSDLSEDTPYNTYIHAGLPPGPICSPGRASLEAAVNPAQTDHFYFVAKGNGEHYFSSSYRSHINAVNRYQKRRR